MFTSNKVSKSMLDAVSKILAEEEVQPKKKLILEPEKKMPERVAADALKKRDDVAAAKGNSADVREGWDDMLKAAKERSGPQPSGGSGVKLGSRYGGGKQKEKPEHDDKEKVKEEADCVTEPKAKEIAKKEVKGHEKHMHHKETENSKHTMGEEEERHMTSAEKDKRERIVKSMKKGLKGFKDRYGDRAKNVMYATATKQAMKEEEEDISEEESGLRMAAHAAHKQGKKSFEFLGKTYPVKVQKEEVNEDIGGISTISEKKKKEVEEESKTDLKSKTVDGLRGRMKVPATYHNQHKDYKIELKSEEAHDDEKEDKALVKKMVKPSALKKEDTVKEAKGTDVNPTFSTDANTTSSPLNLAKNLAHKSFKKIRNEVLGKTGTSEEKKKW